MERQDNDTGGLLFLGMVTGHETGKAGTHEAVTADVSGDGDMRVKDKELISGKFEKRAMTLLVRSN